MSHGVSEPAKARPSRWRAAVALGRKKARGALRRVRRRTGTVAPVATVFGEDTAQVLAALNASSWIQARRAAQLAPASASAALGIGAAPGVPVAVAPSSSTPTLTDDLALRRTAVLLYGEVQAGLDTDIWPVADDTTDLVAETVALLAQPELRDRVAHRQRRDALVRARPAWLTSNTRVSVVCATNRPEELGNVLENAARQVGVDLQLVLVAHGFVPSTQQLAAFAGDHPAVDVQVVEADRALTLGACLNLGIDRADGDDIVKMDDDNYYGANFLLDLSRDLRLSGAGLTGKRAHYVFLEASKAAILRFADSEHQWTHMVQGGTMYFAGDVLREHRFSDIPRAVDTDILGRLGTSGIGVYSSDRFNFVSVRGVDPNAHTWKVKDATMLTGTGNLKFFGDPRVHVEV